MSTTLFLIILIILIRWPLVVAITNYLTRYGGFPSGLSKHPNKYVIWNYMEKTWSIGELDRLSWIDQGVFFHGDSSGNLYEHETNSIQTSPNNTAVFIL